MTDMKKTAWELVEIGNEYMTTKKREDGSEYVGFKTDYPEWLMELVNYVEEPLELDHDWGFAFVNKALQDLHGVSWDAWSSLPSKYQPTYTELTDWLISHSDYMDDLIDHGELLGSIESRGIMYGIEAALEHQYELAFHYVKNFLTDLAEEDEEEA